MEERTITDLGRRVLRILERKGWTQARLAAEAGKTRQWASQILRRNYLSSPTLALLCRVLQVSPEEITGGTE